MDKQEQEFNKKWNLHKVVQEAVEKSHFSPSPQTLLEICALKEANKNIMEKLDSFAEKLESIKIQLAELPEKIFEKGDERYASKTSERVIYGMVGIVITAFIVGLWELTHK